ncbi:redoxin domain-containing protein [Flavobacterium sp.]|uniref:redoxin domain-containing protein n=1 Tax=Flavobacterium sp. TaxID=239 RepID=UPI0039E241A7
MKTKARTLSLVILLTAMGYGQNTPKAFTVSGTIIGTVKDEFAYLYYNNTEDSVKLVNNQFEFKGMVKDTTVAQIYIKSATNAPQFYLENSPIAMEVSVGDLLKDGTTVSTLHIDALKGSHSLQVQQTYQDFYKANVGKPDFKAALYKKLTVFLSKHRAHPFSGAILAELALVNPILDKEQLLHLYSLIDATKQDAQHLKLFKKGIDRLGVYAVGKPFLDFELPDQKGTIVRLKDYRGKMVLVDFWASWCGPCRKKNPELIDLKQEFASGNFEIIGISSDKSKKQWNDAIFEGQIKLGQSAR